MKSIFPVLFFAISLAPAGTLALHSASDRSASSNLGYCYASVACVGTPMTTTSYEECESLGGESWESTVTGECYEIL